MKRNWMITMTLAAALTVGTAQAQFRPHDGFGLMRGADIATRLQFLAEELSLTDEQMERIEAIAEETRAGLLPVMDEMHALREALQEVSGTNYDAASVETLATELGALMSQQVITREAVKASVFGVLTAEQIEALEALREERGFRRPR